VSGALPARDHVLRSPDAGAAKHSSTDRTPDPQGFLHPWMPHPGKQAESDPVP
jgi:hypothetical protein